MFFFGILKVTFNLPYRQLEGFARGLGNMGFIPSSDYSTLSQSIQRLEIDLGYKAMGGSSDSSGQNRDKGDKKR